MKVICIKDSEDFCFTRNGKTKTPESIKVYCGEYYTIVDEVRGYCGEMKYVLAERPKNCRYAKYQFVPMSDPADSELINTKKSIYA